MSNRNNPRALRGMIPLAVALLAASAAPALAQSEPSPMQKLFGAIGLLELPKEHPDYRERAPLVVPPSSALIPPRSAEDIRQYNPDWPVDHDARHGKSDDSHMATGTAFYSGDRLGAGEMTRNRLSREDGKRREAAARRPEAQTAGQLDATEQVRLSPTELGFKGWDKKEEDRVVFTGEPERRSLTEPPAGLRTPSTNAPYGIVSNRPDPTKLLKTDRSALHDDPNAHK